MVLSVFTALCKPSPQPILDHLITPKCSSPLIVPPPPFPLDTCTPALGNNEIYSLSLQIVFSSSFHRNAVTQSVAFCDWLLSLNVFKFIILQDLYGAPFLFIGKEWYFIVWIYRIFFIHSSLGRHLGCSHVLVFMSNELSTVVCKFWGGCVYISLGYIP